MLANILENSSRSIVDTEVEQDVKQDVTGATLRSVKFAIGGAPETESFWSIVLTFSYK